MNDAAEELSRLYCEGIRSINYPQKRGDLWQKIIFDIFLSHGSDLGYKVKEFGIFRFAIMRVYNSLKKQKKETKEAIEYMELEDEIRSQPPLPSFLYKSSVFESNPNSSYPRTLEEEVEWFGLNPDSYF